MIIRGYETNFAEDVELKGVLQLGLSPTHGVSKEEGLLSVQVDEIVNEVWCVWGWSSGLVVKLPGGVARTFDAVRLTQCGCNAHCTRSLRGRMSEEDFKRLPRFVVHQLLDYEVDKASLKGFCDR